MESVLVFLMIFVVWFWILYWRSTSSIILFLYTSNNIKSGFIEYFFPGEVTDTLSKLEKDSISNKDENLPVGRIE